MFSLSLSGNQEITIFCGLQHGCRLRRQAGVKPAAGSTGAKFSLKCRRGGIEPKCDQINSRRRSFRVGAYRDRIAPDQIPLQATVQQIRFDDGQ